MNKKILVPTVFLVGFTLLWQLLISITKIKPYILPAPIQVLEALASQSQLLLSHTGQTILAAGTGLLLALIIAVILAVLMVYWPTLREGLYPILVLSQTVPIVAIYPLLIVWFGYGILPKILVVALVCFFPIVVNLIDGLLAADEDLLQWMQVMGATRGQVLWKLRMPTALPYLFSGLKVAVTYSIMGAVIGEWMGASKGLGVYITRAGKSFMLERVFAAITVISLLSIVLFGLVNIFSKILMPWENKKLREDES